MNAATTNLGAIDEASSSFGAIGLAWAKVLPTVTLVPAFGLKALPAPARGIFGIAIAVGIYPAIATGLVTAGGASSAPWVVRALEQILAGLPVALAAAIPLWVATMTGGLVDALRGTSDARAFTVVEGNAGSFGILLSLFASSVFLMTGGASNVVAALATAALPEHPLLSAVHDLTSGIGLAVAIGGPVLAASVVLEVTFALVARAATPAQVHALFAPIRTLGLLAIVAIVLDRIASLLAHAIRNSLG